MALSEGTPSANFSVALLALLTRVLAIVFELSEPMAPMSRHATHPFDRVGERAFANLLAFAIATAAFHADVAVPHHKSDAALGRPRGPLVGRGCGLRLLVLSTQRRVARPTAHGGHYARELAAAFLAVTQNEQRRKERLEYLSEEQASAFSFELKD